MGSDIGKHISYIKGLEKELVFFHKIAKWSNQKSHL